MNETKSLNQLWKDYNEAVSQLASKLNRTNNIVGEYAEHLTHELYGGELSNGSNPSFDLKDKNENLIQVKSRRIEKLKSIKLNVIRSEEWDFDYLVVLLFDIDGDLLKGLKVPVDVAKEYGKKDNHQNGYVITTSKKFLNDKRSKDITAQVKELMSSDKN